MFYTHHATDRTARGYKALLGWSFIRTMPQTGQPSGIKRFLDDRLYAPCHRQDSPVVYSASWMIVYTHHATDRTAQGIKRFLDDPLYAPCHRQDSPGYKALLGWSFIRTMPHTATARGIKRFYGWSFIRTMPHTGTAQGYKALLGWSVIRTMPQTGQPRGIKRFLDDRLYAPCHRQD